MVEMLCFQNFFKISKLCYLNYSILTYVFIGFISLFSFFIFLFVRIQTFIFVV